MDNPNQSTHEGTSPKTIAIVSHLTIIGFIIGIFMHNSNKSEVGAFYLRQMLGLICLSFAAGVLQTMIGRVAGIISLAAFILWIISFIGALSGEKKLLPVVGEYFQDWFKSIF